jgi:hypothetical protein
MAAYLKPLKLIKVTRVESRPSDAWFDLSLRQLRKGEVNFYRVKDFRTGEWLFKVCIDRELGKVLVKAVKCPPGPRFAQLEGNSMVFQDSVVEGMVYDVVSLTYVGKDDSLIRKAASGVEEIPAVIRENFEVKTYEEATGKAAIGKHYVTLCRRGDEKAMVALFILERAWPLSPVAVEERLKAIEEQAEAPEEAGKELETGQVLKCPICGRQHLFVHVETAKGVRHVLRRHR